MQAFAKILDPVEQLAALLVDRDIGGLWAELSESNGRFVMVRDRRWDLVDGVLKA